MTPLVLALALTSPAQPPAFPRPVPLAPGVKLQPQVAPLPVYRSPVVAPGYGYPVYQPPFLGRPVPPVVPGAVTLEQFSRLFTPTPGRHEVWIIHPRTCQPVKVCFVLPGGKLKEFEVGKREIRFEFRGGYEVDIEFRNNGTVRVEYDD